MYAIVEVKGQQIKVSEGATVTVPHMDYEPQQNFLLEKVLLYSDGDTSEIGQPFLSNVTISATVLQNVKGKKIDVMHYKPKINYHVQQGHRSLNTHIRIDSIRKS